MYHDQELCKLLHTRFCLVLNILLPILQFTVTRKGFHYATSKTEARFIPDLFLIGRTVRSYNNREGTRACAKSLRQTQAITLSQIDSHFRFQG